MSSDQSVSLQLLDHWEDVEKLIPEWGVLLERIPEASIFQTCQWHACWWRAFGGPHRLCVIACYRGVDLVGIAPLMVQQRVSGSPVEVCFIGSCNHASDYADFLVDPEYPEALEHLLKEMLTRFGQAHRIHLSHFPAHSENAEPVRSYLRKAGVRFTEEPGHKAPTRILGDAFTDRQVVNKANLRRAINALRRSGELRYRRCLDESEILRFLDTFFEQHVARRSQTRWPSQFLDPDQRSFFRDLTRELLAGGWLRFDVLLLDGDAVAFHFGFEFRGRFFFYKPTFAIAEAKRSPGSVLLKFMLEDAMDRNLREFDFTVGDEAFKYRFANLERHNLSFTIFHTWGGFWGHRAVTALKRVVKSALRVSDRSSRATVSIPKGDLTP